METLFGLVNVGIAARAVVQVPSFRSRSNVGITPAALAASRQDGSQPSKQMTTVGRAGHR
jgi:hypothetical protein